MWKTSTPIRDRKVVVVVGAFLVISNVLQSRVSCIIIQDSRLRAAIGALVTNTYGHSLQKRVFRR